jgi:phosphatidylserine decarboxylase
VRFARDAFPIAGGLLVAAVVLGLWSAWLALLPAGLLAFTLFFFRDPERTPPADAGAVLAPADGRVVRADAARVSIFLSVFNVHVCRTPVAGRVASVQHVRGRFIAAFRDAASEHNERAVIAIDAGGHSLVFAMVAGLVARRIVCRVGVGDALRAGDRVGLIRFGSRVDVDLPAGVTPCVRVGDRVVAGESVLARMASHAA